MLKEHDLEYRLNGASIKAIITTDVGDIADIVDATLENYDCPSVEKLILVNGAGGGLTPCCHTSRRRSARLCFACLFILCGV
jgi:acetyl-CoA synthetase